MSKRTEADAIVYTIGHSTRKLEAFLQLLQRNNVSRVVDVRTIPRSRHNPQFNIENLPESLKAAAVGYLHMAGLGGLRRPHPGSPNRGWRNASFRGFADYMQSAEFGENLQKLVGLAKKEIVALMCAEAVPWRCHRSLIADALVMRGVRVEHILGETSRRVHVLTPWAQVKNGSITYPPQT